MKIHKARQFDISHIAGPWACELSYLESFIDRSRGLDLSTFEAESRTKVADPEPLDPWAPPTLYERTDSGVALISLAGPITKQSSWMQRWYGGTSSLQVRKAIELAAADPQVIAGVIVADTPGGMHAGTSELAATIRAASRVKPFVTYAEDMACSAGLWALAGGARVYANEAAILGSIGTYLVIWDSSAMYAAAGIKVHVISSAPPIKGSGVPGSEVVPEQLAAWKKTVTGMSAMFERSLADLRGLDLDDVHALATGDVWSAEEAKSYGLIDAVLPLADVIDLVRKEKPMSKSITVPANPAQATTQPTSEVTPPAAPAAAAAPPAEPAAAAAPATPPAPEPAPAAAASPAAAVPGVITAEEAVELRARAERAEAETARFRAEAAALSKQERERRFAAVVAKHKLPTSLAAVFDRIEASDGPAFAAIESAFAAVRAQADNRPLLGAEVGTSDASAVEGTDAAATQIKVIAQRLLDEKKAPNLAAALTLAAQENPTLAAQTRPSGK